MSARPQDPPGSGPDAAHTLAGPKEDVSQDVCGSTDGVWAIWAVQAALQRGEECVNPWGFRVAISHGPDIPMAHRQWDSTDASAPQGHSQPGPAVGHPEAKGPGFTR